MVANNIILMLILQAEHVIREQLKIKETPLLWCHLGDITEVMQIFLSCVNEVCY